jgi:hypothetical protein
VDPALDPQFVNAGYYAHEILSLVEFSSTELDLKPFITGAFNIDHSAVKQALLRGYEDSPGRGRHRELSPEIEHVLVASVAKKAYDNKAVNRTELLNYSITNFRTAITRGSVDSFMSRCAAEFFERKGSSQENQRLDVPRVFLEAAIEGIATHVHNSCTELVFNLDEIGIRE